MNKRAISKMLAVVLAAIIIIAVAAGVYYWWTTMEEGVEINFLGHRFPANEGYTDIMGDVEGVDFSADLMPTFDESMTKIRLTLSGGSSAYDIIHVNEYTVQEFAAAGYLEPLDSLISDLDSEYDFDDIPDSAWEALSRDGKTYAVPCIINVMMLFYRSDIFDDYDLIPPDTFDELFDIAELLTGETDPVTGNEMYGFGMTLKKGEAFQEDFHWWLLSNGGDYFDDDLRSTLNEPEVVDALDLVKDMTQYAPPGVLTFGTDETMVNLQQGITPMAYTWASRCGRMDNPDTSQVVDLVEYALPPGKSADPNTRHPKFAIDGFAISKYSENKDKAFELIAEATSKDGQKEVAGELPIPSRVSVANDVKAQYRWMGKAIEVAGYALPFPTFPEWPPVMEKLAEEGHAAILGDKTSQEAMNAVAAFCDQEIYEKYK